MKIFGKKIGNRFLSIFWNGKPKTIEPKDAAEMEEISENLKKSSQGDKEAIEKLESMLFKDENQRLKNESQVSDIGDIKAAKQDLSDTELKLKAKTRYAETLKSDLFEVQTDDSGIEHVYLKGFKAEIPPILVDKFVEDITVGRDIQPLINFWKLNLTNENPEARRGLYKFIKNQRLLITKHGYFIAFRNIVSVSKKDSNNSGSYINIDLPATPENLDIVEGFVAKVKKQRKGLRSFYVFKNNGGLSIKNVNSKAGVGNNIGYLKDVYEYLKNFQDTQYNAMSKDEDVEVFTDQYTRKMIIKIGEPVRIPRKDCNKDARVECSFGLHVGSQKFVSDGSFGDTIVAVLVNPQHVISVPYSDAHKMRVCEYFPFKKLTRDELINFHTFNSDEYSSNYHRLEKKKMKKVLDVLDTLNKDELTEFKSQVMSSNVSEEELEKKKQFIKEKESLIESLLGDDISKSLDYDEIREIIKSRVES